MSIKNLLKLKNNEELDKKMREEWNNIDYEKKILLTRFVFKSLLENDNKDGSYRNLLYNRLKLGKDSYSFLLSGLEVNNRMGDYNIEDFKVWEG